MSESTLPVMNGLILSLLPLASALDLVGAAVVSQPSAMVAPIEIAAEAAQPARAIPLKLSDSDARAALIAVADTTAAPPGIESASPVAVAVAAPSALSRDEALALVSRGLESLTTARGGFIQTDGYGENVQTGDFYLRRPGRIRLQYRGDSDYLIVSDGTNVSYQSERNDEFGTTLLSATPLKFFLADKVDFAHDANVIDVRSTPDQTLVILEDRRSTGDDAIEGRLILRFDPATHELAGWNAIDGMGEETRVTLIDIEKNVKLSPKLFILENPEDTRDRD